MIVDDREQVAGGLLRARRTIEVHVSHILTKLEARSRVEIAGAVDMRGG